MSEPVTIDSSTADVGFVADAVRVLEKMSHAEPEVLIFLRDALTDRERLRIAWRAIGSLLRDAKHGEYTIVEVLAVWDALDKRLGIPDETT